MYETAAPDTEVIPVMGLGFTDAEGLSRFFRAYKKISER